MPLFRTPREPKSGRRRPPLGATLKRRVPCRPRVVLVRLIVLEVTVVLPFWVKLSDVVTPRFHCPAQLPVNVSRVDSLRLVPSVSGPPGTCVVLKRSVVPRA